MIVKLIPGQRIALTVRNTEVVEGNYGPQIKFSGSTPDDADATVFLNVDTAEGQLNRIGYTVASVIGHTVEIVRVEKNGRKFTDINKIPTGAPAQAKLAAQSHATGNPQAKQPYSAGGPLPWENEETGAPPADALPHEKMDRLFSVYDLCLSHTLKSVVPKLDQSDVGSSPEAVASITATLFIAAKGV